MDSGTQPPFAAGHGLAALVYFASLRCMPANVNICVLVGLWFVGRGFWRGWLWLRSDDSRRLGRRWSINNDLV